MTNSWSMPAILPNVLDDPNQILQLIQDYERLVECCQSVIQDNDSTDADLHVTMPDDKLGADLDPCPSYYQKTMEVFFAAFGVPGLCYAIALVAQWSHEDQPNKCWTRLLRDFYGKLKPEYMPKPEDSDSSDSQPKPRKRGRPKKKPKKEEWDDEDSDKGEKTEEETGEHEWKESHKREEPRMRMLYYLSAIPDDILWALIRGNLPSKMADPDFALQYSNFLERRPSQGNYISYVAVKKQDVKPGSPPQQDAGLSFTLAEWKQVLEDIDLYFDPQNSEASQKFAKVIDGWFSNSPVDIDYSYMPSKDPKDKDKKRNRRFHQKDDIYRLVEWVELQLKVRDLKPGDPLLDYITIRCPAYIGLGKDVEDRSGAHTANRGVESPLFGLINAITHDLFPEKFSVAMHTYQIVRTVRQQDIGFDEALFSALTSAYAWEGGLSANYAGKQTGKKAIITDAYEIELLDNGKFYRNRGYREVNHKIAESRIRSTKNAMSDWSQREQARKSILKHTKSSKESLEKLIDHATKHIMRLNCELLEKWDAAHNYSS